MNQHQTERVRSYLRGRLQRAIVPSCEPGIYIVIAPGGVPPLLPHRQKVYEGTLVEIAQCYGVTVPDEVMHGPRREVLDTSDTHDFEGIIAGVADRPCTRCGLPDRHPVHAVRESDAVSVAPIEGQNAVAIEPTGPTGTRPMRIHKSLVIQFLCTHPNEREQVIPGWPGSIEEYIAELERRPGQFFVNGELIEED